MSGTPSRNIEPLNNTHSELNFILASTTSLQHNLIIETLSPPSLPLITNTNHVGDSPVSLAERPPPSTRLPPSLKIVSWNCCGLNPKSHQIADLFEFSQADILILGETFRQPGTPWPSILPPLLAE